MRISEEDRVFIERRNGKEVRWVARSSLHDNIVAVFASLGNSTQKVDAFFFANKVQLLVLFEGDGVTVFDRVRNW